MNNLGDDTSLKHKSAEKGMMVGEIKDGYTESTLYQPFDPVKEEEERVNKNNAELLFKPEFIQYFPHIKAKYQLSHISTLLYGYIRYILFNNPDKRFYYSNKKLANLLEVSEKTISLAFKELTEKKLIKTSYKIKSDGGSIRFVNAIMVENPGLQKVISEITKSKGNKNNINNISTNVEEKKSPNPSVKDKKSYGNTDLNYIEEQIRENLGYVPVAESEPKKRQRFKNIFDLMHRSEKRQWMREDWQLNLADFFKWYKEEKRNFKAQSIYKFYEQVKFWIELNASKKIERELTDEERAAKFDKEFNIIS